ncbi:protein lin-37 homolog isoform X2 [Thalassophryne amazonica]|uniref:protein lin-37 homolog isoform X2 n=1 Tax=Thalassophryne amazonica TaxID=390379 RepID=UPI00147103D6|nr:protein lin-37 homolog isoform X2 [Thalassophryne amazonica]
MHHVRIKTEKSDLDGNSPRGRLDAVLKGLVEKTETEREQNDSDAGKMPPDSLSKDLSPSSAGKRPSGRFPQHRRKKRKEMDEGIPESNQHKQNAYIIKLFDRSVDLAQFNTSTPLYPICRAWMRNNPSVREPPPSPSPPHTMVEEEVTDMINGKCQDVYRLPPPTLCPVSSSGEPVNLRIPQTDKPTVTQLPDSPLTSGHFICEHMERWKKIRQRWKECSNRNQLRYSESIKVLKEMKELYDR